MTPPKLELKKVKIFMGMDTEGFNMELWVNGKKAAFAVNDGNGGETSVRWFSKEAEQLVEAYVKTLPPEHSEELKFDYPVDVEILLDRLLNAYQAEQQLKRWCKRKTVFRLRGDKPDEYRTFSNVLTMPLAQHMWKKYGKELEMIANLKFSPDPNVAAFFRGQGLAC